MKLRLLFTLLGAIQIAALLVAFERPAQAYVDPGSGFVFLQIAGSMFAGAVYYMRHRLKRIVNAMRRPSQPSGSHRSCTGPTVVNVNAGDASAPDAALASAASSSRPRIP
jgi:hypothetical protein